jgi:hypothetical protein
LLSTATLSLEGRYFYNRERRKEKGKKILNNSGNYLGLEIQRVPDWFTSTSNDNVSIRTSTAIVPKIGMKRAIGNFMTFELAGGLGYEFTDQGSDGIAVVLDLRLGFLLFKSR